MLNVSHSSMFQPGMRNSLLAMVSSGIKKAPVNYSGASCQKWKPAMREYTLTFLWSCTQRPGVPTARRGGTLERSCKPDAERPRTQACPTCPSWHLPARWGQGGRISPM